VFRTHGCRPNNEPWTIGGSTYPKIRAAILLRERLRPYVMEQMKLASERGLPPMRPVFFDFSNDPKTWEIEDQFLFGADILVAPVTYYKLRSPPFISLRAARGSTFGRVASFRAGKPWRPMRRSSTSPFTCAQAVGAGEAFRRSVRPRLVRGREQPCSFKNARTGRPSGYDAIRVVLGEQQPDGLVGRFRKRGCVDP
jgi:hypothetical protein